MKFTHLHTHSHYSLLDGLSKIDELLDQTKALGMESLALTDHGVLYGAVEFSLKAKEKGIKPIIGCEMYIAPNGLANKNNTPLDRTRNHLILLAKNEVGYKNLMKLITIAHLDGYYYKPRIDHATLATYHEGLVCLSGCVSGEVPEMLVKRGYSDAKKVAQKYQSIFGKGNYFLEMQDHPHFDKQRIANEGLRRLSKELKIPLVATGDTHYIHKEDAPIQDILLCIQTNRKVQEKNRMSLMEFDLSLRTPQEMMQAFKETPEAIANTQRIVDLCTFELRTGDTQLPEYPLPKNETAGSFLRTLTEKGLRRIFGTHVTKEHRDRMNYELTVIEKTGYASYTLIVQDFVNWAKNQGIIVGPGRGSAAGSFVSYLIGITNIDPIKYNLLFERYLNPERVSMPDVDMDFADDRRDEVLDYVREKYGSDHVAQIITFGTMAARAAIRDAGRALGLPYDFCDKTAKRIPMFSSIEEALEKADDFKSLYVQDPSAKNLIDSARRLEGVARHASVHACGVVITKKPVVEYTPLQRIAGNEKGLVIQYSSSTKTSFVEKIGLLKMDFLGLKNLTIIQNTLRIVGKTRGINLSIDAIPLDDEKTYALLQKGHTTGVFQLESSGMKRYLKQLKPSEFEDIIAMVALYRPGPMELIPDFIDRKHGHKSVRYLHPELESILGNTYGVAIYQEQVMQIAQKLAGFTLGEADLLRKAMGKKIMKLLQEQREKFVKGCVKNGITKNIGEKVFDFIEPFAGYGFNRSHAACYAMIGYQTAYLKAHYSAEFMAALMTSDQGNIDRVAIEAHECADMGIDVLPPNINESFEEFAVITDTNPQTTSASTNGKGKERIRFGLTAIKNVGHTVAHDIVAERKRHNNYTTLADFLSRITSRDLNKKSLESLIMVGALDDLGERNQLLANIDRILAFSKSIQKDRESNQESLFGQQMLEKATVTLVNAHKSSKKERLQWEKELLGIYVSDHPASEYAEYLEKATTAILSLSRSDVGMRRKLGGVIIKVQRVFLKNQKTMLFVTLEDLRSRIELLVFPNVLERLPDLWSEDRVIVAVGKVSDKDGTLKLLVDDARELTQSDLDHIQSLEKTRAKHSSRERAHFGKNITGEKMSASIQSNQSKNITRAKKMIITLPRQTESDCIKKLSGLFDRCTSGTVRIYIKHNNTKLETPYCITISQNTIKDVEAVSGKNTVALV